MNQNSNPYLESQLEGAESINDSIEFGDEAVFLANDGCPEIIVLEDDPMLLRQLKSMILSTLPVARVTGFDSSIEAFDYLKSLRRLPQLAILDIFLKKGTGIEFSRRLKKNQMSIPHFYVSGLPMIDFLGAVKGDTALPPYLEKPLDPMDLKRLLIHFLPGAVFQ